MKKILTTGLMAVLILGSSLHLSMVYLNYIRTLGIGFTPGINMIGKPVIRSEQHKDIFQIVIRAMVNSD